MGGNNIKYRKFIKLTILPFLLFLLLIYYRKTEIFGGNVYGNHLIYLTQSYPSTIPLFPYI